MTRPTRSTWQQHEHMRTVRPVYPRHTKPTRAPRLTLARVMLYGSIIIAWALIGPLLFTAATNGTPIA